jgi:hypothetical protein
VRTLLSATVALTCVLAACGTAGRSADAAAVVQRFQSALDARDGGAACAQLSQQTASALERQQGHPCEEAILKLDLPPGREVGDTSVYVTSASVSLLAGGTLFLDEAPDGWEISAAGCTPTAPDLPADCRLED